MRATRGISAVPYVPAITSVVNLGGLAWLAQAHFGLNFSTVSQWSQADELGFAQFVAKKILDNPLSFDQQTTAAAKSVLGFDFAAANRDAEISGLFATTLAGIDDNTGNATLGNAVLTLLTNLAGIAQELTLSGGVMITSGGEDETMGGVVNQTPLMWGERTGAERQTEGTHIENLIQSDNPGAVGSDHTYDPPQGATGIRPIIYSPPFVPTTVQGDRSQRRQGNGRFFLFGAAAVILFLMVRKK